MKYHVIQSHDIGGELFSKWDELQRADSRFASPYFRPEFTMAIGRVRSDVRVTVIEEGNRIVGFFPFQIGRWGVGRPVGAALSDYHGVIADVTTVVAPPELVRGSGLTAWDFNHLIAEQAEFQEFASERCESPIMDLSGGFDAYCANRHAAGSKQITKTAALARKLEREHGPIEFEARSVCNQTLDILMGWKSSQCATSGSTDVFGVGWTRQLLRNLMEVESEHFAGMFSTLSVNGKVIASHFGMRSSSVWHYWFPSYNNEFAMYSPGLVLLLRLAAFAPEIGVTSVDLGKGDSFYKSRLANGAIALLEGCVEIPSITTKVRQLRRRADRWVEQGTFTRTLGLPLRALRRLERQRKYA